MSDQSNNQPKLPENIEHLKQELAEVLRLEECDKSLRTIVDRASDYDILKIYIEVLSYFPDELRKVIDGQRGAREAGISKEPGLVTKGLEHSKHRGNLLSHIRVVLNFRPRLIGEQIYVHPMEMNSLLHAFDVMQKKAPTDVLTVEDSIFATLFEELGVTDDLIERMNAYMEGERIEASLNTRPRFEIEERNRAAASIDTDRLRGRI